MNVDSRFRGNDGVEAFAGMTARVSAGACLLPYCLPGQALQKRWNDGLTPVAPFPPTFPTRKPEITIHEDGK